MDAEEHFALEIDLDERSKVEIVIWELDEPVRGSRHHFKYRAAFVVDGNCVLRFDNEAGKGDHLHRGSREYPYDFLNPDQLMVDFWTEVDKWRSRYER